MSSSNESKQNMSSSSALNQFCLVCSKSFAQSELSGHVASEHLGFLPFACTSCDFTAAKEAAVLQHASEVGHIPFVADRSSAKPFLTLLTRLVVDHCQTFAETKNLVEVLTDLNAQIAVKANKAAQEQAKFQAPTELAPARDADSTSSERSSSTLRASLDTLNSNHASGNGHHCAIQQSAETVKSDPNSLNVTFTSSPILSNEADTPRGKAISVNSEAMFRAELCALCASNQEYLTPQDKDEHVAQHLARRGVSQGNNPAKYFIELADQFQRCFPASSSTPEFGGTPAKRTRMTSHGHVTRGGEQQGHVTNGSDRKQPKNHVKCMQCYAATRVTAKREHVWKTHMVGLDRYRCYGCGRTGTVKYAVVRVCAGAHPETVDVQPIDETYEAFDQQFELCFGHAPPPPARRSSILPAQLEKPPAAAGLRSTPAAAAKSGAPLRRYGTRHRVVRVSKPVVELQKLPISVSLRLKRQMLKAKTVKLAKLAPKHKRVDANEVNELDEDIGDQNDAASTPPADGSGWFCRLCKQSLRSVPGATHVWARHMPQHKHFTCGVCDHEHDTFSKLVLQCMKRHPSTKPFLKAPSDEKLQLYESVYRKCFGKGPSKGKGYWRNKKLTTPGLSSNAKLAKTYQCRECDAVVDGVSAALKLHVQEKHFAGKLFECSECGYSQNSFLSRVKMHAAKSHPGDGSVRVFDRRAKFAGKLQQRYAACFPDANFSATRFKIAPEAAATPSRKSATPGKRRLASLDRQGTSGSSSSATKRRGPKVARGQEESPGDDVSFHGFEEEDDVENESYVAVMLKEELRSVNAISLNNDFEEPSTSSAAPMKTEPVHFETD